MVRGRGEQDGENADQNSENIHRRPKLTAEMDAYKWIVNHGKSNKQPSPSLSVTSVIRRCQIRKASTAHDAEDHIVGVGVRWKKSPKQEQCRYDLRLPYALHERDGGLLVGRTCIQPQNRN